MRSSLYKHRWPLAWALLAALAVAAWWLTQAEPEQAPSQPDTRDFDSASAHLVSPDAAPLDASAASPRPTRPKFEPHTLPAGASVREMLDLLGDHARAGDAQAACELAHAVAQCSLHLAMGSMRARPPPDVQDPEQLDRFVEEEARRLEVARRMDQRCHGIGPRELEESVRFTARAAFAGHVDSLIAFLSAPESSSAAFIRDPELASMYRERLWPVLLRAFNEGNAAVAGALFARLTTRGTQYAVSAAVPARFNDPEAARAMHRMLWGNPPHEARQTFLREPPSVEAQATAEAWAQELFGGALPRLQVSDAGPPDPLSNPSSCRQDAAWLGKDQR